jgi:proline-specific peptidase
MGSRSVHPRRRCHRVIDVDGTYSASKSAEMSPTPAGVPTDEGTIPFVVGADTFSTWYKVVGTLSGRTKRPLVVLHGGPGLTHDYLIPLADLAVDRPVIFYDQIGNGQSSRAADKPQAFWTFDLMIDELVNLLGHFKIEDDFDIIGHSWGSQLLPEYILRRSPTGLKHAVFTNPLCDEPAYLNTRMEQLKEFPQWVQDAMMKQDHPDHRKAIEEYASVHFCRVKPMPEAFTRSINYGLEDGHVWEHLCVNTHRSACSVSDQEL